MIRWSTEMGCYGGEIAVRTSVSEIPVDREFESHQPHIFSLVLSTAFKYL
jgi:hypothetical protein